MKKQIIISSLLIILALVLGFTGSVLANNNDQLYGTTIPKNEEEGVSLSEELKNIASTQQKDNRGAVVITIVIITIVLIAGLVMWWYRTNY